MEHYFSQLELESEILKTRLEKSEADRARLEKAVKEEALLRIGEKTGRGAIADGEDLNVSVSTNLAVPEGMKVYVTMKGDTLESLSEFFYGSGTRWPDLYQMNRDRVGKAGRLKSGTALLVPAKREPPPDETPKILAPEYRPPPRVAPRVRKTEAKVHPEPARPRIYVVGDGDTLQSIAGKVYGNQKRWKEIYQANSDKVERGWVDPGQVLVIP